MSSDSDKLLLSGSEIQLFMDNPWMWFQVYRRKRVLKKRPRPLAFGSLWHLFLEHYRKTKSRPTAIALMVKAIVEEHSRAVMLNDEKAIKALEPEKGPDFLSLKTAAELWEPTYNTETVDVEKELRTSLGKLRSGRELILVGRLDHIAKFTTGGGCFHEQNRTLGSSVRIPLYLKAVPQSLHENLYLFLLDSNDYPIQQMCLYNILRKLAAATIKKDPSAAMGQHPVPLIPDQVDKAVDDVQHVAQDIDDIDAGIRVPWRNRSYALGRFGNQDTPWLDVILGDASVDDDGLFENTEERYTEGSDDDE